MIDWLTRLPDSALGILAAGSMWFGFNYAVLGERALQRDIGTSVVPACVSALGQMETRERPSPTGLGALFDMPELDALTERVLDLTLPPLMSSAEKTARCLCATTAGRSALRLDYALHTASFRIMPVADISQMRSQAVDMIASGRCGGAS